MDKQHSDHIEHRIRQAAENITPPFKEEGWQKMEVLLDKEFNKKRRRGFIWWWYGLFVCLMIGGVYYYYINSDPETKKTNGLIQKPGIINSNDSNGVLQNDQPGSTLQSTTQGESAAHRTILPRLSTGQQNNGTGNSKILPADHPGNRISAGKVSILKSDKFQKIVRKPISREIAGITKNKSKGSTRGSSLSDRFMESNGIPRRSSTIVESGKSRSPAVPESGLTETTNRRSVTTTNTDRDNQKNDSLISGRIPMADTGQNQSNITQIEKIAGPDSSFKSKETTDKASKLKISRNIAQPGWYFLASVASEGSTVKKFTLDNRRAVYGIGLGYRLNNRVGLQTGFYASRKIYYAGPADYKVDPGSYFARMKILKVDANCLIYELPLSLRYDVIAHRNFRAYAVAGLSSFIMKSERYKYHLTGSMGYVSKDSTYTSNKNFLSSAGFSIGFEQKLFTSFYIQAEPYIRVPISGVGEGKVKLYSAGLQLGIKYQPVRKKKR